MPSFTSKKEEEKPVETPQIVSEAEKPTGNCPDCNGLGIRNPETDHRVCQTCEGRGSIN